VIVIPCVLFVVVFGLYRENSASESSPEEDSTTTCEPLPIASENPGESGSGKDKDTAGDDDPTELGHFYRVYFLVRRS